MNEQLHQAIFELGKVDAEIQSVMEHAGVKDKLTLRRARSGIQRTLNYIAPNRTTVKHES